jgi:hypothetical protein
MNLRQGSPDVACQIVGLKGCFHVFGAACLVNIIISGVTCCPFCRTKWYESYRGLQSDGEAQKEMKVSTTAMLFQVDMVAARLYEFHEAELFSLISVQTQVSIRETESLPKRVPVAMQTEEIQDLLTHLQDTQPSPLDLRLFNPFRGQQTNVGAGNLWSFRNWHAADHVIGLAAHRALQLANGE